MIRINLLPIKQDRRKEAGRNHLIIGVLVIVVELVVASVMSFNLDNEIAEQKNVNSSLQAQINRIQQSVAGHDQILAEISEHEQRQSAIAELQAARTGPVQVMLELSRVLSKDGKPTIPDAEYQEIIKKNPSRGYDENWDFRRVWLEKFEEKDKNVTIHGKGVSHEDVAEFLRRINLSSFFISSELVSTKLSKTGSGGRGADSVKAIDVVSFELAGKIRYR
ncbi:MAG: PilN domain-containing protein [Deltaproteobacteria bacterium]|nr:PilN domain-containing protein [Deltaproteobacteria bacterium]MBN2672136.1 PilN domain-containing protein [Deltaproteobacteria bacterium]